MSGVSNVSHIPLRLPLAGYVLNNLQDGEPLYVGKVSISGDWVIQKFVNGADMFYANRASNNAYNDYVSAWTAKTSLAYSRFEELKDL